MSSTRPPNNRTCSTHSVTEVVESPSLSNTSSASSTTSSIEGDHDNLPHSLEDDAPVADAAEGEEEPKAEENPASDIYERGRTPTQNFEKYEVDPRSMSPRRNSEELDRLSAETKAKLEQQAQVLQSGLLALLDRVEQVRAEYDKLEGENRFLQEYIGSLMATSKITGSANRGRNSGGRLK